MSNDTRKLVDAVVTTAFVTAITTMPVGAGPSYNPAYQRAGYYRMVLQWKALAQHQKCNPTAKLKPRKSR